MPLERRSEFLLVDIIERSDAIFEAAHPLVAHALRQRREDGA